jgi:MarR family transcriptional regulator, lower aerobic nicotinate degradation pathway regulator
MTADSTTIPPMGTRSATAEAAQAGRDTGAACGLLMLRLARAAGYRLGRVLAELGIRSHQFAVLHQLAEAGPLSQQALGRELRVHPSNLVRLIDELERDGLIVRGTDPKDRRRYLVELTPAGERLLAKARRAAQDVERELLAPLSEAERGELHAMLSRMAWHACGHRDRRC